MNHININGGELDRQLEEWGLQAVRIFANEVADRARDLTGTTTTRPHSAAEDVYSAPGMLRESYFADADVDFAGPRGKVHFATPLGRFRNVTGDGHAAYSGTPVNGRVTVRRRLKSGRYVLRTRRIRASVASFGRGRGDWRSIQKALESLRGSTVTKDGVR